MIKCKKCGAEIDEQALFCSYCGANQKEEAAEVASTQAQAPAQTVSAPQAQAPAQTVSAPQVQAPAQTVNDFKTIIKTGTGKEKAVNIAKFVFELIKKHKKRVIAGVLAIALVVGIIFLYEETHCHRGGCNNSVVSGSSYCYSHKCNLCSSGRYSYSNYCYYHYLSYDDNATSSYSNASSDLKFSNIQITHNSSYTVVTGKVTNYGSRSYKFVTIKGAFKTSSGTVVDTDSTYAVGSEGLAPYESTSFRMSVTKNYSITKCDISITDYS